MTSCERLLELGIPRRRRAAERRLIQEVAKEFEEWHLVAGAAWDDETDALLRFLGETLNHGADEIEAIRWRTPSSRPAMLAPERRRSGVG